MATILEAQRGLWEEQQERLTRRSDGSPTYQEEQRGIGGTKKNVKEEKEKASGSDNFKILNIDYYLTKDVLPQITLKGNAAVLSLTNMY